MIKSTSALVSMMSVSPDQGSEVNASIRSEGSPGSGRSRLTGGEFPRRDGGLLKQTRVEVGR